MTQKSYWIKERHNPQLGIYYISCGQLSKKDAKAKECSLYGDNYMLEFKTKEEYEAKLIAIKASGANLY